MAEIYVPDQSNARYGWVPSRPDFRDKKFGVERRWTDTPLPPEMDLRPQDVAFWDQGQLGSCTANAIGSTYRFMLKKLGYPDFEPSRLFLYYNERAMEGTIDSDSGAMIRDGFKSSQAQGLAAEAFFPYDIATFAQKPSDAAYADAIKHETLQYLSVDNINLNQAKACIAAGYPFVFGFTVYESFESREMARSGIMAMPSATEKALGGHAVKCIGYSDNLHGGVFIIKNSWGTGWGDHGYFYMPYAYMTNADLTSDCWTIREITNPNPTPAPTPVAKKRTHHRAVHVHGRTMHTK